MPITVFTTKSPVPMPYSPSPVYSQRPPSKSSTPTHHIIPIKKADMILSYSSSSTPSHTPSPSPSLRQKSTHSHALIRGLGVFGVLMFFVFVLRAIRNKKPKKVKAELTQSELIIHQINPTAYSKLNLIHRGSSSLNSSGNVSPV
jgi:hypothetical protein